MLCVFLSAVCVHSYGEVCILHPSSSCDLFALLMNSVYTDCVVVHLWLCFLFCEYTISKSNNDVAHFITHLA